MKKKCLDVVSIMLSMMIVFNMTACGDKSSNSETTQFEAETTQFATETSQFVMETSIPMETSVAEAISPLSENSLLTVDELETLLSSNVTTDSASSLDFTGYWEGKGGRYSVGIENRGDYYSVFEEGSGGASRHSTETMTGIPYRDKLVYSDGRYTCYQYGEDDDIAAIVEYSDGKGVFIRCSPEELAYYSGDNFPEYDIEVFAQSWEGAGENDHSAENGDYLICIKKRIKNYASSEYVIWYSSQIKLTEEDVEFLSEEDRRLACNEIYARHGIMFDSEDFQQYFNGCSWYQGTIEAANFNDDVLNSIEKQNIDLLQNFTSDNVQ